MGVTGQPLTGDRLVSLLPALARAFGVDDVELVSARPLSAGASRLTWALDVRVAGDVRPLVLQRERAAGRRIGDMATEARLLRAAHRAGVPVPSVLASDPAGPEIGGAYLITSRVEGETIPRRILRDPALAGARGRFAVDCGRILAAIHGIALAEVDPLARTDPLDQVRQMLDRIGAARPTFELALRWLTAQRPPSGRTTLVHGDFRIGNLVMGSDGVRAVLDWELGHGGDPLEDIGWLCARVWRFGAAPVVGGMGDVRDLLASYERHGGCHVSEADLFWWQVYATVRWGAICLEQARVHLEGEFRSIELAVLGRRAAEVEYDLLRMLP